MELTTQAKWVLVVGIIQLVCFEIITGLLPISLNDKMVIFFLILITMGIATLFYTYSINCMVQGSCTNLAWICAGFIIAGAVFALLSTTISALSRGGLANVKKNPYYSPYIQAVNNDDHRRRH